MSGEESKSQLSNTRRLPWVPKIIKSATVREILGNVNFSSVQYPKSDNGDDLSGVVERFKTIIETHPDKTHLGGEQVLTVQYPTSEHDTSMHLMHFNGTQDKHLHRGPRVLTVIAKEPWSFYVGQQFKTLPESGSLEMVRVDFSANSITTVTMSGNLLHGFSGKMGAISVHYTDAQEAKELRLPLDRLQDPEIMNSLTEIPDQSRIEVIACLQIGQVESLQKTRSKGGSLPPRSML